MFYRHSDKIGIKIQTSVIFHMVPIEPVLTFQSLL